MCELGHSNILRILKDSVHYNSIYLHRQKVAKVAENDMRQILTEPKYVALLLFVCFCHRQTSSPWDQVTACS